MIENLNHFKGYEPIWISSPLNKDNLEYDWKLITLKYLHKKIASIESKLKDWELIEKLASKKPEFKEALAIGLQATKKETVSELIEVMDVLDIDEINIDTIKKEYRKRIRNLNK